MADWSIELPPSDREVDDPNHVQDHNAIVSAIGEVRQVADGLEEVKADKSEIPAPPTLGDLLPAGGSAGQYLDGNGGWSVPPDTNTTYQALSAQAAQTGTDTTGRLISAKVLHDEIARQIAAALTEQAG